MTPRLVLSLFPGIGLLDRAFEEHGFCIVRGPDLLWGGDIHRFSPPAGVFDGIIGGPPCQAFSALAAFARSRGAPIAPDLIPQFERCVGEAAPRWVIMENVPRAPTPRVLGYDFGTIILDNRWCGGVQSRKRRISFACRGAVRPLHAFIETEALEPFEHAPAVVGRGGRLFKVRKGGIPKRKVIAWTAVPLAERARLQGLPSDFLAEAPFTAAGKGQAIANGVPLPMGRALARAVLAWTDAANTAAPDARSGAG